MSTNTDQKILGLRDIALLTFIPNFGIRWFAIAAGIGASSIFFWVLGGLIFFLPLAFIVAQLSQIYPEEGGIYAWTRQTLGESNGFLVAWLYWINNIFYYPAILIFLTVNFAYFLGHPELANNSLFVCATVLVAFWFVVLISLFGLKSSKGLTEYSGILGSIIPTILLIGLGFGIFIWSGHSATVYNWHTMIPNEKITHNLSNLTMIMFAMAGVEIVPTFANSVKNPKSNLYVGLLIGAIVIMTGYIVSTIALNLMLSPAEVQNTSGLMQAFQLISFKLHLPWFTQSMAFLLVFAELAAVSIWLIAPITMFFKCTPKGLLPVWCQAVNPKNNTPQRAIIFVGVLVTLIVLATNFLPSVNNRYQELVLMAAILYFIPYLLLAVVYLKNINKIPGIRILHYVFALGVFLSVGLGIIFSFQPPAGITGHAEMIYEIEMIVTTALFVLAGYAIYFFRKKYIQP